MSGGFLEPFLAFAVPFALVLVVAVVGVLLGRMILTRYRTRRRPWKKG